VLGILKLIYERLIENRQPVCELFAPRNVDIRQPVAPLRQLDYLGKESVVLDVTRHPRFRDRAAGNFLNHVRNRANHRLSAAVGGRPAVRLVRHTPAGETMKKIRVLHRHGKRLLPA
jgi:hypothetical protein